MAASDQIGAGKALMHIEIKAQAGTMLAFPPPPGCMWPDIIGVHSLTAEGCYIIEEWRTASNEEIPDEPPV